MKLHDTRLEWRQCLHTSGKLVFAFSRNGSKETIYIIHLDPISKRGTAKSIQYFSVIYCKWMCNSGSSGRVRGGEKHEICAAAFGSIFFMTYFYRAGGIVRPPRPHPGSATDVIGTFWQAMTKELYYTVDCFGRCLLMLCYIRRLMWISFY